MNAKRWMRSFVKMFHSVRLLLCGEGYRRAEYIRKHKLFGSMGENCYWHPWKMPGDPELIFIHDNVKIASDVTFFTTVTLILSFFFLFFLDVTVILHFPVLIPFTYPDDETVAIFLLEDL